MATLVVLTHALDELARRPYLVHGLVGPWERRGHRVLVHAGPDDPPPGDAALVHVDCSVVPPEYVEAARRYPVAVNVAATDVRKRLVSRQLVRLGDGWSGPVIVKSDLNCCGIPERLHDQAAVRRGLPPPHGVGAPIARYDVHASPGEVPDAAWEDRRLVVERFLPERDEHGYAARAWVFLGDRERCNRLRARSPIVKGAQITAREPCAVPDEVRAARARIGLDFGKIDFVVHEGRPIVLDATRTPGAPPPSPRGAEEAESLAAGIEALLARANG